MSGKKRPFSSSPGSGDDIDAGSDDYVFRFPLDESKPGDAGYDDPLLRGAAIPAHRARPDARPRSR